MKIKLALTYVLILITSSLLSAQSIIYVKQNGTGNGSSWINATGNLQAAIDNAYQQTPKGKVWVASGTYFGDSIATNNAFTIKEGVNVYAGFEGNEPSNYDLSLRNFNLNTSILEGQNVQRVLGQDSVFNDSTIITVWDGFTIQNGYNSNEGGGVKLSAYSKISNCIITNNTGRNGGGLWGDSTIIFNCKIVNNTTTPYQGNYEVGGGLFIQNSHVVNCNISENYADFGGGFWTRYSTFVNCNFSNNSSSTNVYPGGAGAGYVWAGSTFINCLIANNTTTGHCGGIYVHNWIDGPTDFINCDIVNNTNEGIFMQYSSAHTNITNCIIWGNDTQISGSTSRTITYSAVQGGASGNNNIDLSSANDGNDIGVSYVRFVDPDSSDFNLQLSSVCVNAGTNTVQNIPAVDIGGNQRISNDVIDIGAYERFIPEYCITNFAPQKIGNSGFSEMLVEGNGFDNNTNIFLTKSGQDTIFSDTIKVINQFKCISSLNFDNVELGFWNLTVSYSDTLITILDGLEIEAYKQPELSVSILGPSVFRANMPTTYVINVENKGNTTAYQVPLNLKILSDADVEISNLKLSDNIPKPSLPEDIDLSQIEPALADTIREYFENFEDIDHFIDTMNVQQGTYTMISDFFIEVPANSSFIMTITLSSNRDTHIEATVPSLWESLILNKNGNDISTCCILKSINCVVSIADIFIDWGVSVECIYENIMNKIGFTLSVACANPEYRVRNAAIGGIDVYISSFLSCIPDLKGFIKKINKVKKAWVTGYYTCGGVINSYIFGECFENNYTSNHNSQVVQSYDPNDKIGYRSSSGSLYFNDDVSSFQYIINFENKSTATAPAQEVFITDTLNKECFHLSSFRAGFIRIGNNLYEASLNTQETSWQIDMRPEKDLITDVNLTFDTVSGVAHWHFKCLDIWTNEPPTDPLTGFLPPNDSLGSGEGCVTFSIDLKPTLSDTVTISNRATIIFDNNEPILTPSWQNKKDVVPPTSKMLNINIISDSLATISWAAEDNQQGSGLYGVNLYMKKDGGEYEKLLNRYQLTSYDLNYEMYRNYSFYVLAIDSADNIEFKTTIPEIIFTPKPNFDIIISRKWDDVLVCHNTNNLFESYQWFKDDSLLIGETKQFYQEMGGLNGKYFAEVKTINGTKGISNIIDTKISSKSFYIFPNPSENGQEFSLVLSANESDLTNGTLSVISVSGQIIMHITELQQQMRLKGMSPGFYLVQIRFSDGERITKKLLVK